MRDRTILLLLTVGFLLLPIIDVHKTDQLFIPLETMEGAFAQQPFYPVVSVEATNAVATEGLGPGQFKVTTEGGNSERMLSVAFSLSGTAVNGVDYVLDKSSPVNTNAGGGSVIITVTPVDDGLFDGSETVTLTIEDDPAQYVVDPNAGSATVTIQDNDFGPGTPAFGTITNSEIGVSWPEAQVDGPVSYRLYRHTASFTDSADATLAYSGTLARITDTRLG